MVTVLQGGSATLCNTLVNVEMGTLVERLAERLREATAATLNEALPKTIAKRGGKLVDDESKKMVNTLADRTNWAIRMPSC